MINQPHIYKRKIVSTGKYYVGKHNGNNTNYKGSGVEYLKDYKLYVNDPKTDLEEEILEIVSDISKLDEREEYWLKLLNVAEDPLYYNKTNRSRGWSKVTDEQKQKISNSKKGKLMTKESSEKKKEKMLGKPKHTEESKKKIGEKNSKPNPKVAEKLKNKPKTKEHKEKIKESKKFQTNWKKPDPIIQLDINDVFIREWESIKKAQEWLGKGDIRSCCKGKQKSAGGYIWKYKNKNKKENI